ncbi:ankyrin repeat and MYND domain-containing protein 2-like [Tigriopus californicus]|uniref:ankyrin repeat and MYND domain-containing protein 2-like n=1 Tax=Tigriopus californicus TaxID=6832 RepID=UPI0027D9E330|nr:ankyrin repeat and MYND domain-containing protein 2-like [Tigriopus californicus]
MSQSKSPAPASSTPQPAPFVHPVFEIIQNQAQDDPDLVAKFFDDPQDVISSQVDLEDENGCTALILAAWKGKPRILQFLIDRGIPVNGGNHEHGYTALHFAALSGNPRVCEILVQNGANPEATNSVKRTPSQMAAFVGNHTCVSIINNFVPKESVYYFTRKQPLEDEAKLPIKLAKPIHTLVMKMNTHPVSLALHLRSNPELLESIEKVVDILERMSNREFKDRKDVNEVLSLKFHIIYYVLKDIMKQKKKYDDGPKKNTSFIDLWIKSMLTGRESDGYPVFQEDFLRQGVKEFPYKEAQLFKILVSNFSHCQNYGDSITAAEFINQSFNGQKGFKDKENCDSCGNEDAPKKCAKCKSVQYCDQTCQKLHWFMHKKYCDKLKETHLKQMETISKGAQALQS